MYQGKTYAFKKNPIQQSEYDDKTKLMKACLRATLSYGCETRGQDYKFTFFEHGLVLNSQSVLRNDVTLYCLARYV